MKSKSKLCKEQVLDHLGVRVYTRRMDFTLTRVSPSATHHPVVIDWSQVLLKQQAEQRPAIDKLIDWLKDQPNRRDIQIYLGPSRFDPAGRQLQKTLQALGCIVTNRSYQAV